MPGINVGADPVDIVDDWPEEGNTGSWSLIWKAESKLLLSCAESGVLALMTS